MKFNFRGIRFNTWLYFLGFSITILALLGFLLVVIIKPYYRNNRIEVINNISNNLEESLINKRINNKDVENTAKMFIGNNVCALVYNEHASTIFYSDALGEMCLLDKKIDIENETINIKNNPYYIIDLLKNNESFSYTPLSDITGSEMLIYGKMIKANLANYYLIINTPLEPVDSYVNFILNQYLYVTLIVIGIALIIAYLLSNRITSPIIKIKNEAIKLADGNYDLDLKTDSFREINDLAYTLDDATKKLSKLNDLRQDIVANVSHDIKTPLTMIKAYAEMIKDISGDDPIKREEHLNVIIKETEYLNNLVTDMTELSKLQSGNITLNKANFDLADTIEDVISLLEQLSIDKNITIIKNLKNTIVYADEIKMSQVIYNFLSNSLKYSKDNSKVIINMDDDERKIRVEVIDEGDGISKEALPYIWDRYYKIDKSFNRNIDSTGLGLAIAKAILEAHNAQYGVISKVGKGSTFYFELFKDYEEE